MASVDDFVKEINRQLALLPTAVQAAADAVGKQMADEAARELRRTSPKKSGKYARSWSVKTEETGASGKVFRVYNKKHYQLTHLLEFGHIIADTGGRTRAQPHIADADRVIRETYPRRVEEAINREIT